MQFKDILKAEREKAGFTQQELAHKLDVYYKNISKYENGYSQPSLETLSNLATIFGCTTDYLLGRSQYKNGVIQEIEVDGTNYKREIDKDHITEFTPDEVRSIIERLQKVERKINKM